MRKPKIVQGAADYGAVYVVNTRHTSLSQRDTLEATLLALAEVLGIAAIERSSIARGNAMIYRATGSYMSASNLILDLSLRLVMQTREERKQARKTKAQAKADQQAGNPSEASLLE